MEAYVLLHDDFERGPLQDFCVGVYKEYKDALSALKCTLVRDVKIEVNGDLTYATGEFGACTIEKRTLI